MMLQSQLNEQIGELNRLYMKIVSVYGSLGRVEQKKKELTQKMGLINEGIKDEKNIISLLSGSNSHVSDDLEAIRKEYGEMKGSMAEIKELVEKLEKMDLIKSELAKLKWENASTRLKVTPLTGKSWKLHEEIFYLRKDKIEAEKEHSEMMKKRDAIVGLRPKVLPLSDLLDLRERLSVETTGVEKNSEEAGRLKEELARVIPIRDNLSEELEAIEKRLSSARDYIKSVEEKIKKISPRIMPEDDMKKIEEDVSALRQNKEVLTDEKKKISSRIASIAEEEETITSTVESYKLKIKKDSDRLSMFKKEMKGMDLDKDSVDKLREDVDLKEGEFEARKKELDDLKKEHSEVIDANQKYKAIIDEVQKKTQKLKKMLSKKKKK